MLEIKSKYKKTINQGARRPPSTDWDQSHQGGTPGEKQKTTKNICTKIQILNAFGK